MRKLQHLRQHLLDRVAGLAANPDRLLTFVQDGAIEFHRGQHLSHEYQVPAQLVLTDYSGDLDEVMIPLLQWLSRYEPGLSPKDGLRFEAEILANNRWDLMLTVPLTERVVAVVNCDEGRIDVEHRLPEYDIEPCPAEHWRLYIRRPEVDQSYE
ncbi:MAG: phage tail protein, partial [Salinisphaeraceae bacterium]